MLFYVIQAGGNILRWCDDAHGRRKDSVSDLLIILALNVMLLVVGATFKLFVIDGESFSAATFWAATYNVRIQTTDTAVACKPVCAANFTIAGETIGIERQWL
jgi:hypothetical protein